MNICYRLSCLCQCYPILLNSSHELTQPEAKRPQLCGPHLYLMDCLQWRRLYHERKSEGAESQRQLAIRMSCTVGANRAVREVNGYRRGRCKTLSVILYTCMPSTSLRVQVHSLLSCRSSSDLNRVVHISRLRLAGPSSWADLLGRDEITDILPEPCSRSPTELVIARLDTTLILLSVRTTQSDSLESRSCAASRFHPL